MLTTLRSVRVNGSVPPHVFFLVSAVFHYLGPAFAVLLFAHVNVLGVAWLRIASAAAVFALWRRPWRIVASQSGAQRTTLLALGVLFMLHVVLGHRVAQDGGAAGACDLRAASGITTRGGGDRDYRSPPNADRHRNDRHSAGHEWCRGA